MHTINGRVLNSVQDWSKERSRVRISVGGRRGGYVTSECSSDHKGRGGGVRGNVTRSHVVMVRPITINFRTKFLRLDCSGGRNPRMLSYLKEC